MHNDPRRTYRGWCCVDCLMWLANGEAPADMGEAETESWLADMARCCEGAEVTLGMFAEDHDCATNWTVTWRAHSLTARGSYRGGTVEIFAKDYEDALFSGYFHDDVPADGWTIMAREHELETVDDCECERISFTWSSCDVCGSGLGGQRDAVVFWLGPEPGSSGQPDVIDSGPPAHANPQATCPACLASPRITPTEHAAILGMAASLAADRERAEADPDNPWF